MDSRGNRSVYERDLDAVKNLKDPLLKILIESSIGCLLKEVPPKHKNSLTEVIKKVLDQSAYTSLAINIDRSLANPIDSGDLTDLIIKEIKAMDGFPRGDFEIFIRNFVDLDFVQSTNLHSILSGISNLIKATPKDSILKGSKSYVQLELEASKLRKDNEATKKLESSLSETKALLDKTIEEKDKIISELRQENDKLRSDLQIQQTENKEAKKAQDLANKETSKVNLKLEQLTKEKESLLQQIDEASKTNKTATEELATLKQAGEHLEESHKESLKAEKRKALEAEDITKELEKKLQEQTTASLKAQKEFEDKIEQATKLKEELVETNSALQSTVAKLEQEALNTNNDLEKSRKESLEAIENLSATLESEKNKALEAENTLKEKTQEFEGSLQEQTTASLKAQKELESKIEQAIKQKEELAETNSTLQSTVTRLKQEALEAENTLKEKTKELEQKLQSQTKKSQEAHEAELQRLNLKIKELEEKKPIAIDQEEAAKLKDENKSLTQLNNSLVGRLAQYEPPTNLIEYAKARLAKTGACTYNEKTDTTTIRILSYTKHFKLNKLLKDAKDYKDVDLKILEVLHNSYHNAPKFTYTVNDKWFQTLTTDAAFKAFASGRIPPHELLSFNKKESWKVEFLLQQADTLEKNGQFLEFKDLKRIAETAQNIDELTQKTNFLTNKDIAKVLNKYWSSEGKGGHIITPKMIQEAQAYDNSRFKILLLNIICEQQEYPVIFNAPPATKWHASLSPYVFIPDAIHDYNALILYELYQLAPQKLLEIAADEKKLASIVSNNTIDAMKELNKSGHASAVHLTKLDADKVKLLTSWDAQQFYKAHPGLDFEAFSNKFDWTIKTSFRTGWNITRPYEIIANILYTITHPWVLLSKKSVSVADADKMQISFSSKVIDHIDHYFMHEKQKGAETTLDITPKK